MKDITVSTDKLNLTKETLDVFYSQMYYRKENAPYLIPLTEAVTWLTLDNQIRYRQALDMWAGALKNGDKKK